MTKNQFNNALHNELSMQALAIIGWNNSTNEVTCAKMHKAYAKHTLMVMRLLAMDASVDITPFVKDWEYQSFEYMQNVFQEVCLLVSKSYATR